MNARSVIIFACVTLVVAIWTVPRAVLASQHEAPPSGQSVAPKAAEAPRVETLEDSASQGDARHGGAGANAGAPETAAIEYILGEPLKGHFDLNVLRSAHRISQFRYAFEDIVLTVRGANGKIWAVNIGCQVEFGSESGMAEIKGLDAEARQEIQDLVRQYPADVLLKTSGKLKLKEDMARAIDRLLVTAAVRRIYLTDFQILFIS